MSYFTIGAAALAALLAGALAVAVKVARARGGKVKELEGSLESARTELRRLGEYQKKKEEAQRDADKRKETLHTGDAAVDFTNSLGVLHGASGDKNGGPGA